MDTEPNSPFPPPAATSTAPTGAPPPAERRDRRTRTRHAGHVVAIVFGCLLLLPGLGMLAGGSTAALAQTFATDDDGYYRVTLDRTESAGAAIATTDLLLDADMDGDPPTWVFDALDVDMRLRVGTPDEEVFVGIARAADVEDYLEGVAHTDVIELRGDRPVTTDVAGAATVDPPATQTFWLTSASGDRPELEWDVEGGRWSVVVMNADGSPGVAADVEVGIRSGAIVPVAAGLMIAGAAVIAGAVVLLVIGIRGRRPDEEPTEPGSGAESPLTPVTPTPPVAPTPPVDALV